MFYHNAMYTFFLQLWMILQLQAHFNLSLKQLKLPQVIFIILTSLVMVDLVKFTRYNICSTYLFMLQIGENEQKNSDNYAKVIRIDRERYRMEHMLL